MYALVYFFLVHTIYKLALCIYVNLLCPNPHSTLCQPTTPSNTTAKYRFWPVFSQNLELPFQYSNILLLSDSKLSRTLICLWWSIKPNDTILYYNNETSPSSLQHYFITWQWLWQDAKTEPSTKFVRVVGTRHKVKQSGEWVCSCPWDTTLLCT